MPICHLERYERPVPYPVALARQRELADAVLAGVSPDTLLLLEHPPTITITRGTSADEIRTPTDELAARGIAIVETDRGGRSTYHAPGQLVVYPILDLRRHGQDLHVYLRSLEWSIIAALADVGVTAEAIAGLTGVWTGGRKIAAIGVKTRRWVTMHGLSVNVDPDLRPMRDDLVPCGLYGRDVTSIAEVRGDTTVGRAQMENALISQLAAAFNLQFVSVPTPGSHLP